MNSYNVTSPTPSVTSSVAVDGIRVSRLCNLAIGCTGKSRFAAVEKRRRKSRMQKLDREDISRARTKSLPLPKRQNMIRSETDSQRCVTKLARQPTPSSQRQHKIVSSDAHRIFRDMDSTHQLRKNCVDDESRQRPLTIHRRAASMESIQQVFDFYDDEDTSVEGDQRQHQASEEATFEVIDIVEPSETSREDHEYCKSVDILTQKRQHSLIRNISPSLPLESDDSHGYKCGIEEASRHKLSSPELGRLATISGVQRSHVLGQAEAEERRQCPVSARERPGLLMRHRSESALPCTGTVLRQSGSCSSLLEPGKVSEPPSHVFELSRLPQMQNGELNLVSSVRHVEIFGNSSVLECMTVLPVERCYIVKLL
jgi:hypothetical protein